MPAYVSTVTFGRMLVLTIETKEKSESVQAFLNLAVSGVVGSGGFDASFLNSSFVRESLFRVVVLGGPTGAALHVLNGPQGMLQLREFFQEGINFTRDTPAVPLSYQLRSLGDNASARMVFSTDYEVQSTRPQAIKRFGARFQTEDDNK
jgi:thiol-activated cytolysin